jgi:hypothetical protein
MQRAKKNYLIYAVMLLLFGALIYMAIEEGDRFSHHAVASSTVAEDTPFTMFCQFVTDNLHHPLSILLIQIIAVLLMTNVSFILFLSTLKSSSIPITNMKRTSPTWLSNSRLVRDSGGKRA